MCVWNIFSFIYVWEETEGRKLGSINNNWQRDLDTNNSTLDKRRNGKNDERVRLNERKTKILKSNKRYNFDIELNAKEMDHRSAKLFSTLENLKRVSSICALCSDRFLNDRAMHESVLKTQLIANCLENETLFFWEPNLKFY